MIYSRNVTTDDIINSIVESPSLQQQLKESNTKLSDLLSYIHSECYSQVFVTEEDKIICIAGINYILPKVGHMWFYHTELLQKNIISVIKLFKKDIQKARVMLDLHRLETSCYANESFQIKFNLVAGFELECAYIPKADTQGRAYSRFRMIWED